MGKTFILQEAGKDVQVTLSEQDLKTIVRLLQNHGNHDANSKYLAERVADLQK